MTGRRPATGADNPLRSLGATYARQALAASQERADRWLATHARPDDLEIRPGVFRYRESEKPRPDYYICQDCRKHDPIPFMVEDDVWEAAGLFDGIICPACLETRLGRKLTIQDFKASSMNNSIFLGYLMGIIQ